MGGKGHRRVDGVGRDGDGVLKLRGLQTYGEGYWSDLREVKMDGYW